MEKLFKIVIDVQGGDLLDICNRKYEGEGYGTIHSDHNGEAVIEYLKEWDEGDFEEVEFTETEPRWVNNGTDYVHTSQGYTLLYNATLGGVYMLYREATEEEIANYKNNK